SVLALILRRSGCGLRWQQELRDLANLHRGRLAFVTHEGGHTRGVADYGPGGVVELDADEDVARQQLALDLLALAVLELSDFLDRDDDLVDLLVHAQGLG